MTVLSFLKYLRGIFNTSLKSKTVHHAVIQSIYDAFVMVDGDLNLMRLEMCLSTATGKWLDHWGEFFSVHRKLNETDSAYAKRIIEYVIRPKTTIPAIKDYIVEFLNDKYGTDYTSEDVDIKEPWKDIAKYSHKGLLSSDSRFFSGDYYSHSIIDISIPEKLTQDLIDLVLAVKAAGVRVVWSFLNSYDIVSGFNESNEAWANYIRHILTETHRNTYSGLMLSNSSLYPTLSGRREIWFEIQTLYCWYAKMLDKDTDKSILITKSDLSALLDYYEQIDQVFYTEDTGLKVSVDGVLSNLKTLSGSTSESEMVTHLIHITDNMLESLQLVDDWLTLSYKGKLSTDSGVLFNFEATHELLSKILSTIDKFKQEHRDYYNALQPPILMGEQAQYLVPRNNNWLFHTPTMSLQDFYELWEMGDEDDTLQDIYNFEQMSEKRYLTFGDVYQPPIVIAGSPWDWTPIMDSPWLWKSATLTNEELEEIYRMKFSGFPDLVEIQTTIITHPENNFTLSNCGQLSAYKYSLVPTLERSSEPSLRLSEDGKLSSDKLVSGEEVKIVKTRVENENFLRYTFLSGDLSTVTKNKIVTENVPTLGQLIEFEENQDIFNPNEKILYSTRDWMQAPVQIGEYAQWLIAAHTKQLWDTLAIANDEIMSFWDEEDKSDELIHKYIQSSTIYQPPIVIADSPFYWTNRHDIPWLWFSSTLNNEELEELYREKFAEHPELFPDIVTTTTVTRKNPVNELRLSDNGHMPDNHIEVEIQETRHLESAFRLSDGGTFISGDKTNITRTYTVIPDEHGTQYLSGDRSTHIEQVEVEEKAVTLGTLIEWEEKQPEVQYSTRYILQAPIIMGDQAMWLVSPNITQLWDTPTISNKEIHEYWEGIDRPATIFRMRYLILNDSNRYQPPIEIGDKPYYWTIPVQETQLWDSPTMLNEEILNLWVGTNKPDSTQELKPLMTPTRWRYQPPIVMAIGEGYGTPFKDTPWLWASATLNLEDLSVIHQYRHMGETLGDFIRWEEQDVVKYSPRGTLQSPIQITPSMSSVTVVSVNRSGLWDTPTISNKDILYLWEGNNRPSALEYRTQYLAQDPGYNPPISVAEGMGLGGTLSDQSWLWSSQTLTNGELPEVYSRRLLVDNPTLGQILNHEQSQSNTSQYSSRSTPQSPIQITSE